MIVGGREPMLRSATTVFALESDVGNCVWKRRCVRPNLCSNTGLWVNP